VEARNEDRTSIACGVLGRLPWPEHLRDHQPMSDEEVQRDLGRMEAQIETLCHDVKRLTIRIEDISETLSEAKGGWKTLMWVSGASATVGGLIAKFAPWLMSTPLPK
jgi:hypothetical protein